MTGVRAHSLQRRGQDPHTYQSDGVADYLGDTRCRWCGIRASHKVHTLPERDEQEKAVEARRMGGDG